MMTNFALPSKILVTGATGFVGKMLLRTLLPQLEDHSLRIVCREYPSALLSELASLGLSDRLDGVFQCDLSEHTDWNEPLEGCQMVVHLAARVHVMNETLEDPLTAYRAVNVEGTHALAEQAVKKGVRRFIYLSSIKVNGEETAEGKIYRPEDHPCPEDDYGQSKWEAEQALLAISQKSGMQVLIIRPPLIYGPGVKANFLKLINVVKKGYPLPLKSINNRRSLLSIYNLLDFILCCLCTKFKASQIFCISDGEDLSTSDLLRKLADAMETSSRLFACPPWLLQAVFYLGGRKNFFKRLTGSLQIDGSKASALLHWQPKVTVDEALKKMIREQGCSREQAKGRKACLKHDHEHC